MELLWESFAKEGIHYPSPDWHGKVLAERSEIIFGVRDDEVDGGLR
jgi:hypothetical protein